MKQHELQVAVDVGARTHRVAVGDGSGRLLEEFDLEHTAAGFAGFFTRIERLRVDLRWKHSAPSGPMGKLALFGWASQRNLPAWHGSLNRRTPN